jgi:hypothetical protein
LLNLDVATTALRTNSRDVAPSRARDSPLSKRQSHRSVNVGRVPVESHSNILALGYTVLGRSDGPFEFGVDVAEGLVIAGLRELLRF